MIEKQVPNTLATYEASRNNICEQSRVRSSIHGSNNDVPKACTYEEFMKYQPRSFYCNEGVIWLTIWIEKMESIFLINSYVESCRVKFATCTFMNVFLARWNNYTKIICIDLAYATTWG